MITKRIDGCVYVTFPYMLRRDETSAQQQFDSGMNPWLRGLGGLFQFISFQVPQVPHDASCSWRMLYKSCDRLGIPASQAVDLGNLSGSWEQHEMGVLNHNWSGKKSSELFQCYCMFVSLNDHEWPLRIHESSPAWAKLGWLHGHIQLSHGSRQAFSHVQYSRGNYSHPSARSLSQEWKGARFPVIFWYFLDGLSWNLVV